MSRAGIRNGVVIGLLLVGSTAYFPLLGLYAPVGYEFLINFVGMPSVVGLIGYLLLKGKIIAKLLLLAMLPVAHVLYFGGDDAKPGLENVVALVELVFLVLGALIGALVNRLLKRYQSNVGVEH